MKRSKTITVLLTASGGLGIPSIITCLKNNPEKKKIRVICADISDVPLLHFIADGFHILPRGNSKNYIRSITKLCQKEKIDVIMPGAGIEILALSNHIEKFESKRIAVTISNQTPLKILKDKHATYKFLEKYKIPVPKYFFVNNRKEFLKSAKQLGYPQFPICFKPSKYSASGGARGFRILRKNNSVSSNILDKKPGSVEIDYDTTLKLFSKNNLGMLVMEYLPGEEYSVYVLCKQGKTLYCIPQLRKKLQQFYSFEAVVKKNKTINDICKKIVEKFGLDFNINIQIKISRNGIPKVVEINPRMGGSISLSVAAGINLPFYAVKLALNEKIPKKKIINNVKMNRYWKELFSIDSKSFEL